MDSRTSYKTKQRDSLLAYFIAAQGEHRTAGDVCRHFRAQGVSIGQSTVYRQLERLVDEGILSKYTVDGSSSACFAYVGADSHADAERCYHCKCEKCGRLIHLHCEELEDIQRHMLTAHSFRLNPMRTVFYGLCEQCAGAAAVAEH